MMEYCSAIVVYIQGEEKADEWRKEEKVQK